MCKCYTSKLTGSFLFKATNRLWYPGPVENFVANHDNDWYRRCFGWLVDCVDQWQEWAAELRFQERVSVQHLLDRNRVFLFVPLQLNQWIWHNVLHFGLLNRFPGLCLDQPIASLDRQLLHRDYEALRDAQYYQDSFHQLYLLSIIKYLEHLGILYVLGNCRGFQLDMSIDSAFDVQIRRYSSERKSRGRVGYGNEIDW